MFNRRSTRFFRKDGHDWKKKTDGKTVKETHEKLKVCRSKHRMCTPPLHSGLRLHASAVLGVQLARLCIATWPAHLVSDRCLLRKVGNKDTLNCYYAHCQEIDTLQVSPSELQLPVMTAVVTAIRCAHCRPHTADEPI